MGRKNQCHWDWHSSSQQIQAICKADKRELLKIFMNQINELRDIVIFVVQFKITLLNHVPNHNCENRKIITWQIVAVKKQRGKNKQTQTNNQVFLWSSKDVRERCEYTMVQGNAICFNSITACDIHEMQLVFVRSCLKLGIILCHIKFFNSEALSLLQHCSNVGPREFLTVQWILSSCTQQRKNDEKKVKTSAFCITWENKNRLHFDQVRVRPSQWCWYYEDYWTLEVSKAVWLAPPISS